MGKGGKKSPLSYNYCSLSRPNHHTKSWDPGACRRSAFTVPSSSSLRVRLDPLQEGKGVHKGVGDGEELELLCQVTDRGPRGEKKRRKL